jgi:hypothetical protein
MAAGLRAGRPRNYGSIPGRGKSLFSSPQLPYRPWDSPKLPYNGYRRLLPPPGHRAGHSYPFGVEKNT